MGRPKLHPKARAFKNKVLAEYELTDSDRLLFEATIENLSCFWEAADQLRQEGLVVGGDGAGMVRKNPLSEIKKFAWSQFLAGLKLLGVGLPEQERRRPYGVL